VRWRGGKVERGGGEAAVFDALWGGGEGVDDA
jgi:hypothetical protein